MNNQGGKRVVAKLRCKVCLKFKDKITGRRNYSDKCVMVSFREFFPPLRSSLSNDLLDDLLVLNTDRIPLKDFNLDHSISLWSSEKTRRPNQGPGRNIASKRRRC